MDFSLEPEQVQLRDVLARCLADRYAFAARREILQSPAGWSPAVWRMFAADLGLFGAALPGADGGGAVEIMVIMTELGRALVVEPVLETLVIGAGLLRRCDGATAQEAIGAILAGTTITAFAWRETGGRFDPTRCATVATRDGGGWRLDGRKTAVVGALAATHLLVTSRSAAGLSLFLVARETSGLTRTDYATVDGRRAAEVTFDAVHVGAEALLGVDGAALPIIDLVLDEARAALCAEAIGVLAELQRQTLDHVRQRRQFGVAIGTFQVLQHRLADMYMQVEQAISMTYLATLRLDAPAPERQCAVAAAKAFVGNACRAVGQSAVQIHGAIGLTDELPLSHYFKRAAMIEIELGSVDDHLARFEAA